METKHKQPLETPKAEPEYPCYHCKGKGMEMWGDIKLSCWRCYGTGRMTEKLAGYRRWEEGRNVGRN